MSKHLFDLPPAWHTNNPISLFFILYSLKNVLNGTAYVTAHIGVPINILSYILISIYLFKSFGFSFKITLFPPHKYFLNPLLGYCYLVLNSKTSEFNSFLMVSAISFVLPSN